jgi:hypothetical protein
MFLVSKSQRILILVSKNKNELFSSSQNSVSFFIPSDKFIFMLMSSLGLFIFKIWLSYVSKLFTFETKKRNRKI